MSSLDRMRMVLDPGQKTIRGNGGLRFFGMNR